MPEKKTYTYEQFSAIRRYGAYPSLSFSPDGSQIAYTVNTSGQLNLWRQSSDGGFPHQLTLYNARTVRTASWSPDGKWIAYIADRDGDEFHQVYLISAQGGQPQQLTDLPKVQHSISPNAWSPNGRYLAYSGNDRHPTDVDVLVRQVKTGQVKRVLAGDANYYFGGWAKDNRRLLAVEFKSNTDTDIHLVHVPSGSSRLLTEHEGETKFFPGPWAADGSGFYMVTDWEREFSGLAFYYVKTGKWVWVETPEWDIEFVTGSEDGRYLAWVVNENGYSRLYMRDLHTDLLVDLPEIQNGLIHHPLLSPDGNKLAFFFTSPSNCFEIMVIDTLKKSLQQITYSMLGGIPKRVFINPKLIRYPTYDKHKIPAWLYKPKNASKSKKIPVVISIHGGPEAQELPAYLYSGLYQYLLNRGIGILAPNIRGSTGYGKTYQKLVHRDWGGDELKDIEYAAKYLLSLDWIDPQRIGIFGGSFGGFATLSAVSRLPDYWAAAVDVVGPSNLVTFAKAVPPFWRRFMEKWVGDPEKDHDFLMERSPISYVDQIKTPLFIIQGANDPRVVKAESDQIVDQLRSRGVEVRYDVYEDEGHGFTKRHNELKAWRDTAEFFESHLLGEN
jgi:dipeptidyl aminopeptidase/acylaminoacyl peptidase